MFFFYWCSVNPKVGKVAATFFTKAKLVRLYLSILDLNLSKQIETNCGRWYSWSEELDWMRGNWIAIAYENNNIPAFSEMRTTMRENMKYFFDIFFFEFDKTEYDDTLSFQSGVVDYLLIDTRNMCLFVFLVNIFKWFIIDITVDTRY